MRRCGIGFRVRKESFDHKGFLPTIKLGIYRLGVALNLPSNCASHIDPKRTVCSTSFTTSHFLLVTSSGLSFTLVCVSPPNPIINHGLHQRRRLLPTTRVTRPAPKPTTRSTNIIYIIIQQLITKKTMTKFDILQVISSAVALAIITAGNDGNVRAFTAPVGGGRQRPSSTAGG